MKKLVLAVCAVVLLGACSAKNEVSGGAEEEEGTETTSVDGGGGESAAAFGDLADDPCGDGAFTVEASESPKGTDKLYIGVANDRTSQIRSGLNKELWDASNAFVAWCNEQGGIGGLPIEIVDLDGKLLEVEASTTKACNEVFIMVGGGQVQDNLQFNGKEGSDFHLCGLADVPGFAVSPEKAGSNGAVQALPNPAQESASIQVRALKETQPDKADKMAVVWGDLPAMEAIRNQQTANLEAEGVENVGDFPYPVTGLPDWTPLATQVIDSGANAFVFVGEPTNLGALVTKLREQGWEGVPLLETNAYDQVYAQSAGPAGEGSMIRSVFHPFEEADQWPATQQYLDILRANVDDPKDGAVLGMYSFSAWLLFATAANDCASMNDDVLTRDCVLKAAASIEDWTGGGLHAPSDPGSVEGAGRPTCEMLITLDANGNFERAFPEVGSDDDDLDGFWCQDDALVEVPANEGLGKVDPDRAI